MKHNITSPVPNYQSCQWHGALTDKSLTIKGKTHFYKQCCLLSNIVDKLQLG